MILRARWVLPIERPPLHGGWVSIDGGIIRAVGDGAPPSGPVSDLGDAALLPGLINAHTHLELSWLEGRVPPAPSMVEWIRELMRLRREVTPDEDVPHGRIAMALARARERGTLAFGDISNTLVSSAHLKDLEVPSVLFHELLGFPPADVERRAGTAAENVTRATRPPVRPGLAPHAPYSTSPELFQAIARAGRSMPMSVHLGESPEEVEFLATGGGAFVSLLKDFGVWRDDWRAPACDPVAYLDGLGVLTPGLLVVHATHLRRDALDTLAARSCVIVSCPRSNRWVGAGDPPLDDFYASGARVALGTDSLASAASLDMFDELAAARAVSTVPDRVLLESATRGGAIALELDAQYGRIAPGLRAPLLAVGVPAGVTDVEQYLVASRPETRWWVGA